MNRMNLSLLSRIDHAKSHGQTTVRRVVREVSVHPRIHHGYSYTRQRYVHVVERFSGHQLSKYINVWLDNSYNTLTGDTSAP